MDFPTPGSPMIASRTPLASSGTTVFVGEKAKDDGTGRRSSAGMSDTHILGRVGKIRGTK